MANKNIIFEKRLSIQQVEEGTSLSPKFDENGYACQISFYVQNYPDPVIVESFLERLR